MEDARLRTVEEPAAGRDRASGTWRAGRSPGSTWTSCVAGPWTRWRASSSTTRRTCARSGCCWPTWSGGTRSAPRATTRHGETLPGWRGRTAGSAATTRPWSAWTTRSRPPHLRVTRSGGHPSRRRWPSRRRRPRAGCVVVAPDQAPLRRAAPAGRLARGPRQRQGRTAGSGRGAGGMGGETPAGRTSAWRPSVPACCGGWAAGRRRRKRGRRPPPPVAASARSHGSRWRSSASTAWGIPPAPSRPRGRPGACSSARGRPGGRYPRVEADLQRRGARLAARIRRSVPAAREGAG